MKKTKKKTVRASKAILSPEKYWLGNPLFMAALLTIMGVVAFILAEDWIALKKTTSQPVPAATVTPSTKVAPTATVTATPTVKVAPPKKVVPPGWSK